MIPIKKMYETAMISRGDCDGKVEAPNGSMHIEIDRPGTHSERINPKQLFAAGYASCLNGATQYMLEEDNLESDLEIRARVSLFQLEDGGYRAGVVLEISLLGFERDQAEKIAEEAYASCPYSKAARGNIDVEVIIVEQGILNVVVNEAMKDLIKKRQ